MKQHRTPRSMGKRKAPHGAFQVRSQPRVPRREAASDWPVLALPEAIVTHNSRDLLGSITVATPDGGWLVLTPHVA